MATRISRRPVRRTATVIEKTMPAPVGGWNARDSIASMPGTDALALENWIPGTTSVDMRPGHTSYATQLLGMIKTLAVYRGLTGDDMMFAFTDQGVQDVSFGGDFSSAITFGARTNGKHQTEMFGDGTNNWLIAVNGVDKPWYFNGSTYVLVDGSSTPLISGLTTSTIVSVLAFKKRLFLIRNDKLGFDYLPAGAVGGAATYFDLASIASLGGYLMAMAVWTRDAGDGPDDFWVGLTSQGEAIVYQGIDPGSASTWELVGTFRIGKPLGRRCVIKYGADPLILTEEGVFPLSALLSSGDERDKYAVSFKIQNAFSDAARNAPSTFGWELVSLPEQNVLMVNVPIREDGPHEQYVMHTISKSWCKFTGWHAESFAVYNRELYFCRANRIYRAWTGTSDNGSAIVYSARQAYMDFGSSALKMPSMFMPILDSNRTVIYQTGIDTDFETRDMTAVTTVTESTKGRWGVSRWDAGRWTISNTVISNWGGTAAWPGRWLSGKLQMASDSLSVKWMGSVIRFEVGSGL